MAFDLPGKTLAETEQALARLWAEAEQAVLRLDDAGSFLRRCPPVERFCGLTEVKPMLAGMAYSGGLFICATKHWHHQAV